MGSGDGNRGRAADWVREARRASLLDMHIPDWDPSFLSELDTKAWADAVDAAGVQAAYVYTSSCLGLSYWPTPVGRHHPGLRGRDMVGEITAELHRRGKAVVLYLNFWSKWASDTHPDWRIVRADGRPADDPALAQGRYGVCCLSSPYMDHVRATLRGLCEGYDAEGYWIDMLFWPLAVCFCGHCRRRWGEESGRDLPRVVDWDDPSWVAFQRARERWLAEAVESLAGVVRDARPGASFGTNHSTWSYGWLCGMSGAFYRASDYLTGDFEGAPADESLVCKFFHGLTRRQRFEFMTPRCTDLREHTTSKPAGLLEAQAFSTFANNGRFLVIDAIDPAGTIDARAYRGIGAIYRQLQAYEPLLGPDAEACADVALYGSIESFIDPAENGRDVASAAVAHVPLVRRWRVAAKTLVDAHVPFGVMTREGLDALPRCRAVVLSDLATLDADEARALEAFVADGGVLVASGGTSLRGSDGRRRQDFLLRDMLGVSREGETVEPVTYLAPTPAGAGLLDPHTPRHPLALAAPQVRVRALPGTEVLATLTLPYMDPAHPERFSSTISNPPMRPTGSPALTVRRHGKGAALYAAGPLEAMDAAPQRAVFVRILRSLLQGPCWFEADAPRSVELTLFRREPGRFVLSAVSFQPEQPNIPVEPFEVRLSLRGATVHAVRRAPDLRPVAFAMRGGQACFRTERLETYQAWVIDAG